MARHIKTPARLISEVSPEAHVPPEVEALVMRVLSKEPEKRPDNAEAMIAELTRVKESAVVTSGVRASLASGLEMVLEGVPRSVPPPPMPTASALAHDTLSVPAGLPSRSRRWVMPVVGLAILAVLGSAILFYASASWRTPAAVPATSAASVRPTVAPPPTVTASAVPAAKAPPTPTATEPFIPTMAASALPRPEPTRPEPKGHPRPGSKPAGTSSVGYGYLE